MTENSKERSGVFESLDLIKNDAAPSIYAQGKMLQTDFQNQDQT